MKKPVVKEYLTEALFQLMIKKEFHEITVSELINKAGVCRASFYRNYLTKEQILDEYLEKIFEEYYRKCPLTREHMQEDVEWIFVCLLMEKERLSLLKEHGLLYKLDQFIYQSTLRQIQQFDVLNNRYQPYYFAGAASAIIKAWIMFGFEETPREISRIFFKSLDGYMNVDLKTTGSWKDG